MADDAATTAGKVSPPGDEPGADAAEVVEEIDTDAEIDAETDADAEDAAGTVVATDRSMSPLRVALIAALIAVLGVGCLSGWLGYHAYQSQQVKKERELYLQVARQGALNLTTIDYQSADADIQRILDSATGQFYDDFAQRSQPFVEVVKQAQSKSVGKVTEAGLESATDDQAQAIVAVSVNTSNVGAPEQQPRSWRMRLTVQKVGEDVKVSKVGFVP